MSRAIQFSANLLTNALLELQHVQEELDRERESGRLTQLKNKDLRAHLSRLRCRIRELERRERIRAEADKREARRQPSALCANATRSQAEMLRRAQQNAPRFA